MTCSGTETVRRRLWRHASTRQAVQVSTSCNSVEAERLDIWLPLSQIAIVQETHVVHRDGPDRPKGTVLSFGTILTVDAPAWLLRRKGITADAELTECMREEDQ